LRLRKKGKDTVPNLSLKWEILPEDEGKTVKKFLREKKISRAALNAVKYRGGSILVNGEKVNVRKVLKAGDLLQVLFPDEEASEKLRPQDIPLNILYEDEYLLVIDKPAPMDTIPPRNRGDGSLANALLGYYEKIGLKTAPHIVTRLDRNTSGLVLVAKYQHIHSLLARAQRSGGISRRYIAFCEGVFSDPEGVIEAPIGRKPGSIIERTVSENGRYARTEYEVLKQYDTYAKILVRPKTGRTHQIRVHFSHIGHPLLGDSLYGGNTARISRQALHCREISFCHPIREEPVTFVSELPEDMQKLEQ
jgi:23S rRNA pseudouridine1911/1915/1917 synthase